MKNTIEIGGIKYFKPEVYLLNESGIGASEVAARTCYDSFDKSENLEIKQFGKKDFFISKENIDSIRSIESSELLYKLAWVHFHHSILEHSYLTFLVKGTSRGVLQEHARHRMQNLSVKSTRYTMGSVLNAFLAPLLSSMGESNGSSRNFFHKKISELEMFVTADEAYNKIEIDSMFDKLEWHMSVSGMEKFIEMVVPKSKIEEARAMRGMDFQEVHERVLQWPSKRNVGDPFKHLVTDNWKTDFVFTMNLRSLKNYLELRNSGAAYPLMKELALAVKIATPKKYLELIVRS